MVDAFQYHLKQLIHIKIRSILLTIVFIITTTIGVVLLKPTNAQQVIFSIYTLLVFVAILIFIQHLLILRYFFKIRQASSLDRELTVELFQKRLPEANDLRTHVFLKKLAYHFIEAYWAYQTVTD